MNMENPQHKAILEALKSGENDAIRDAAFSAGDQGLQDAVPMLCEHIKSPSVGVQEAAEYALRKIRGPQVVVALLPLLSENGARHTGALAAKSNQLVVKAGAKAVSAA